MRGSVPFTRLRAYSDLFRSEKESVVSSATTSSRCEKGRKSFCFSFPTYVRSREYFSPSFYLLPCFSSPAVRFSPYFNGSAEHRGTFGYFTFNFVSSAHSGGWENYVNEARNSGEERRRAGRAREPRVEIIVATLIIYSLPTLTPIVP